MEFKGTKGLWKLANNDYGYYTSVRNLDDSRKICVSRVNNQIENNANLLLISKAPQMLEVINKINHTLTLHGKVERDTDLHRNILQLIKEATEI